MMSRSGVIRVRKGLVKLNKVSYLVIIVFLLSSFVYYSKMDPIPTGTIIFIKCITILFAVGGLKHMISIGGDSLSDGIDIPGVGS